MLRKTKQLGPMPMVLNNGAEHSGPKTNHRQNQAAHFSSPKHAVFYSHSLPWAEYLLTAPKRYENALDPAGLTVNTMITPRDD
ncbi:MAG: hypothetical protein Tsb002_12210 [Wenzhouxiangellaceae bacterium]